MAQAARDNNRVTTLLGVSSSDGVTPIAIQVDPTTGAILTDVSGTGTVSKVGTPVNDQVGVWTGDGTIEGTTGLTYSGTNLLLTGDIGATGTRITKGWFTDLQVTNNIAGGITGNSATVTGLSLASGSITLSGGHAITFTTTGTTGVTLPTTGTLVNTGVTSLSSLTTIGTLVGGNATAVVDAASLTVAGKVELATTAEIDTGTDTTRAIPADQFVASIRNVRHLNLRVIAAATANTATTLIGGDFEMPFTGTIVSIGAYVDTAGITNLMTIDVNKNGTTLMTTNKITLDSTEKSSRTAVTAPALTTTAIAVGDLITIDVDGIQTTAALGLTVRLGVRLT